MTSRTDDQKEADAALDAALDKVCNAYSIEGVRVGFLIAMSHVLIDTDGHDASSLAWHAPEGQSWIASLGLIEALRLRYHRDYLGDDT